MYSDSYCAAIILLAIALKRKKIKKKRKRIWCKKWYLKRNILGQSKLLKELELTSKEDFKNYVRMDKETFEELLTKVEPYIAKQDTFMRQAIPARHRLSLTLRFLASGNSFEDLKFLSAIAPQTIGGIVMVTCEAIIEVLNDYIKLPESEQEWKKEAEGFSERWNFPHCIGAVDGKHINITKPPGSGSYYFNYKKHFSVLMMAVVNSNYEFLMVDVGANGRASDAGLFSQTKLFSKLKNKTLNIPNPESLPGWDSNLPYVFVSDDAFPLMENIMKPFSYKSLDKESIIFNYRLSRARGIVENAFGILVSRFRILLKTINLSPEKVTTITLACCYLHNFLRRKNDQSYSKGGFNVENTENGDIVHADWQNEAHLLDEMQATTIRHNSKASKTIRQHFSEYFNTVGAVPWQNKVYEKHLKKDANGN